VGYDLEEKRRIRKKVPMKKLCLLTTLVLALTAPAAFAEEPGPMAQPASADAEAVRKLFQSPGNFRVAQGATVPISLVHAGSFRPFDAGFGLSPNTFGTIFAEAGVAPAQGAGRLLPDVPLNVWGEEFVDGVAPTSLDGVSVLINGKPAFISFIGRAEQLGGNLDQINFLSPDDDALGPVTVEVFQGDQLVAASVVDLSAVSPGLFVYPGAVEGGAFAAALGATGGLLAPAGHFGDALMSAPIAPGGVMQLFASGFGATDPPGEAGRLGPFNPLSRIPLDEISITIGGLPAEVTFAGLAPNLAGLYQFNLIVPALPNGNHSIIVRRNGIASQDGVLIPVLAEP